MLIANVGISLPNFVIAGLLMDRAGTTEWKLIAEQTPAEIVPIPPLPDTGNRRSLVDVRDVVRALALVAFSSAAAGKTFLVTDGHWYSTHEMYSLIRAALGQGPARWHVPAKCETAVGRRR